MISKQNRVDKKLIDQIFKTGRFISSSNLTFKFTSSPTPLLIKERGATKIAFIVSKTVSKKAVVRNLLRRRGYFILKKYIKQFPVGISGAFIFGKKSFELFGKRKSKIYNPIQNLELEIKAIINRLK